ncbi:MAG: sulfite exporter TauE/SafE family protein [Pseudomonadota bacterium]
MAIFNDLPLELVLAAACVTFLGGFVKGAVGFAMPLIMVAGLSFFLSPQLTVATLILPVALANLMQAGRHGLNEALEAGREHWRYLLIVCVAILLSAQLLIYLDPADFYLILGMPVVFLTLIQLVGVQFHVPPARRRLVEWSVGALAGGMGGLTGTWGPPTVLYLMALGTERQRQMLVQGLVYGLGAAMLLVAHLYSGVLNRNTWQLSAAMLIPATLGMYIGFRMGDRLNAARLRQVTLLVLLLGGLNLIRRGLIG